MAFRCSTAGPCEWIDRGQTLHFRFEGHQYSAHPGDSITSALMANGITTLGRSFKYHRPRASVSVANHDANVLLASAESLHLRGDTEALTADADLRPVNVSGSLASDPYRFLDRLGRFLPVGFYYKAFHRPRALFPVWERLIRSIAGLGRTDPAWYPLRQPRSQTECDILVVGGGPAGLSAVRRAADQGLTAVLVEEEPQIGGSLDYQWATSADAQPLRAQLLDSVTEHPLVKVHTGASAAAIYPGPVAPVATREGLIDYRFRAAVLATGAIEQPPVFRNNDRPGVIAASGAQRLLHRFGVVVGRRLVVVAANPEAYRVARDLQAAGAEIAAIAVLGTAGREQEDARKLEANGVPLLDGYGVVEAHGQERVHAASLAPVDGEGRFDPRSVKRVKCDAVIGSVGWIPAAQLLRQAGGTLAYDSTIEMAVPDSTPPWLTCAGRLNGVFELNAQLADGEAAVDRLFPSAERQPASSRFGLTGQRATSAHGTSWPIVRHPKGRDFLDFDSDQQTKDVEQAAHEGFEDIELLKRFSTLGMGPSQGKHANFAASRVLAHYRGTDIDTIGMPTARPPWNPLPLEQLAGHRFRPRRRSGLEPIHEANRATFMVAGPWRRPRVYAQEVGEMRTALEQEVRAVRERAGLIDVSTLGKIEVVGPDAVRLLEACYVNRFEDLGLGRSRYALMVDESGVIVDDGVAGRLGEQHFYVTTTTPRSEATLHQLRRHIQEFDLEAWAIPRTGQVAAINIAGPLSREILAYCTNLDLAPQAFPPQGIQDAKVCGHPARILRVGFVATSGYEIHLAPETAPEIWNRLLDAGAKTGIRPFGVDAQRVLRLELGHVLVGQDTDGLTDPFEAGLGSLVAWDKPWFVGRAALAHRGQDVQRHLVGFELEYHSDELLPEPGHLAVEGDRIVARVTSCAWSPSRGSGIGLAMAIPEHAAPGTALSIRLSSGQIRQATVIDRPFIHDPKEKVHP